MLNSVSLVGRLTRDPELSTTKGNKKVCSFSLAVSKRVRPQDGSPDADFFNVVAWNHDAEYIVNFLGKGRLIAIEGRLQSRKYTASDGSNREVVEVVANHVQSLDRPSGAQDAKIAGVAPSAESVHDFDPFESQQ